MNTDLQISPTHAFPSEPDSKLYTIEEGVLKEADVNHDDTILDEIVSRDHNSVSGETFPLFHKQVVKERIQLLALFLCMYLLGWNDGGLGALLPRIQQFYHVSICANCMTD